MRVGILTLHAQTNYGGVLQAYALQEALRSLGHEPVVIDRWLTPDDALRRGILSSRSPMALLRFVVRGMLGLGDFSHLIRCRRTARFLAKALTLSSFTFYDWKDAPANLGVEALVVGSDQVWNPGQLKERCAYLLEGAPGIPAIAYAASLGVRCLPPELKARYQEGLGRFGAISMREQEGVGIVRELGFSAEHVVDPVLLVEPEVWNGLKNPADTKSTPRLFVYLIHMPVAFALSDLISFAKRERCEVDVYVGGPSTRLPHSLREVFRFVLTPLRAMLARGVHFKRAATPDEFVSDISAAKWVVTDSFHGLMFSAVFNKNVRVLSPRVDSSKAGFARLFEFVSEHLEQEALCDSVGSALASLQRGVCVCADKIAFEQARKASRAWLANALTGLSPRDRNETMRRS